MSKLMTDGFNPKIEYKGGFDQILIVEFYNSENSDNVKEAMWQPLTNFTLHSTVT